MWDPDDVYGEHALDDFDAEPYAEKFMGEEVVAASPPQKKTLCPIVEEMLRKQSGAKTVTPWKQLKQICSHLTKTCANSRLAQYMVQENREYTMDELRKQWEIESEAGADKREYLHGTHLYKCKFVPDVTPNLEFKKDDLVVVRQTSEWHTVTRVEGSTLHACHIDPTDKRVLRSDVTLQAKDVIKMYKSVCHGTAMPMCYVTEWGDNSKPNKVRLCQLYYDACDRSTAELLPTAIQAMAPHTSYFAPDFKVKAPPH